MSKKWKRIAAIVPTAYGVTGVEAQAWGHVAIRRTEYGEWMAFHVLSGRAFGAPVATRKAAKRLALSFVPFVDTISAQMQAAIKHYEETDELPELP